MTLIIYYMVSLTNSLRESNNDLKVTIITRTYIKMIVLFRSEIRGLIFSQLQLRKERTEERRKMFKIAEKRLENSDNTPFARWKKILPNPTIIKTNDDSIKTINPGKYLVLTPDRFFISRSLDI